MVLLSFILFSNNVQAKTFDILNPRVNQGGTVVIKIDSDWFEPEIAIYIQQLDKKYKANKDGKIFIGINVNTPPGIYILYLVDYGTSQRRNWDYEELEVTKTDFEKTRMSSFTGPPKLIKNRRRNAIDNAFSPANQSVDDLTDNLGYVDPLDLNRDIIDPFGLIYANNPYRFHNGVDLKTPVGTPVKAVNRGQIVLIARKFRNEGNMVIINHGLGIFSVYMHLSKFGTVEVPNQSKKMKKIRKRDLKIGDTVERGQVIGLSGRTGAGVREPHLHFNIKIQDSYIDPLKFIDTINKYLG